MKPIDARLHHANSASSGQPVQSSEGTDKLFIYGTLLIDDVITTLIDRIPSYQKATAPGWRVVRLPQRIYPGLVSGHSAANGRVLTDLTEAEWSTLDTFEDPAYTLATIRILLPAETNALTYLWCGEHLEQPWSTTDLSHEELAHYLDRCRTWRQHHEQRSR